MANSSNTNIGWIGTGIMGASMCHLLMTKGYKAHIYNRSKPKTVKLVHEGARLCENPAEVAENSDVIFTIVAFPDDVREVYFGDNGIFSTLSEGKTVVDMTTSEPMLAEEIYNTAKELGAYSVDAPVSGGDVGAKEGKLSIMVGGDKEVVDDIMPLLNIMGRNIVYQGKAGSGQHAKMSNQIMVAGEMIGMCETLLYAHKAGLDLETMLGSVGKGAASCWLLDNLAPRILKEDYRPGFIIEHFIKDMSIALKEADRMNINLPGLSLVRELYLRSKELGHGRSGTQALILALDQLSKDK